MKYNQLISNAPAVSEIGLGTWQLGINSGWQRLSDKDAYGMINKSFDLGINFIDTAPNYGLGTSEIRLGKVLQGVDRDKFVINTKFGHTDSGTTNYEANYIVKSLEGSLKRLKIDYVDSIIIHNPPFEYLDGNKNDHYEILERLKEEGKIRAYGASLDTASEMKLLMETTGSEIIEAFFNILHQDTRDAFDMARQNSVGIIAKIPLDSGWLTGKYDNKSSFNDIRSRWSKEDIRNRHLLVNKLQELINKKVSLAQVAIAYCLAYDAVGTVIPGNMSVAQLESNAASTKQTLSTETIKKFEQFYLENVKPLGLPW